jgi:tetratricopeptide (TPR) repeat protein
MLRERCDANRRAVRRGSGVVAVSLALLLGAAEGHAQSHAAHRIPSVPDELLSRPVTLREGTGRAHDTVTTTSREAQAFYDQGLAYLHSYVWIEAARSFNQALRHDPALAMAHVGLSVAYVELNAPAKAQSAIQRAQALAKSASDHDRRHVEVRAAQLAAEAVPGDVTRLATYRGVLDRALELFPKDAELWLLRGVAESSDPADRGQGSPASAVTFFQKALDLAGGDLFAADHYLTHAFENSGRLPDAIRHAERYARTAPRIPHALHMYGHVLRRTGQIDEAIARFEEADRLHTAYFKAENVPAELDWHYEHNLDLLASSYCYIGLQMFNKRNWPEYLIARGRTEDALAAARTLIEHPAPLVRATGHIAAGHAHLAAKRFKEAADEANAALKDLRAAPDGAGLVAPAFERLQGEFFLRTGQRDKGRAMLREVARKVRESPGPDNWVQALFTLEAIARAAREAGDWELAAWAATEMRGHDPRYGGSHYALGLLAEHNGNRLAAEAAFAEAERLWSKADPNLPELREVRLRSKK